MNPLIIFAAMLSQVSAMYFFMEPEMTRCFKDNIKSNYVSNMNVDDWQTLEMTLNVLDKDVVDNFKSNLRQGVDGINVKLMKTDPEDKKADRVLYQGTVWPNDLYEYETDSDGEYTICVKLTDSMFH